MYRTLGILIIGCGGNSGQPIDAAPRPIDAARGIDAPVADARVVDAAADASLDSGITAATVMASVNLQNSQNGSLAGSFAVFLHTMDAQTIDDATVTYTRDGVAGTAALVNPGIYSASWTGNPSAFAITVAHGSDVLRTYNITAVLVPTITLTPNPPVHGATDDVTWTRPDVADHASIQVLTSMLGASYTGDPMDPDDGVQTVPATAWMMAGQYTLAVMRARNPTSEITLRAIQIANLIVP